MGATGWKRGMLGLILTGWAVAASAAAGTATQVAVRDAVSPNPLDVAWDGRSLYYADSSNGNLYRLDPLSWASSNFNLGKSIHGVTHDGTNLWVMRTESAELLKVSPKDGQVLASYAIPSDTAAGLAYGDGLIWISESAQRLLYQFDPAQGAIVKTLAMPEGMLLHGLAWRQGTLFAIDVTGNSLVALNPETLATLATYPVPTANCHGMGWMRMLGEDLLVVSDKIGKKLYFLRLGH